MLLSAPCMLILYLPYQYRLIERTSLRGFTGCRAGNGCPFRHDPSRLDRTVAGSKAQTPGQSDKDVIAAPAPDMVAPAPTSEQSLSQLQAGRQYVSPFVDGSRLIQRPIPRAQADDPRAFQIRQLKRRFSAVEAPEDGGTAFSFQLIPSDPDFPFEMAGLECVLHVPLSYPKDRKLSLDVKNREMGRGYQINVERGFDALVAKLPQSTLLGLMNTLDKQLEMLLKDEKAQTIKIVTNAGAGRVPKPISQNSQGPPKSQISRPVKPAKSAPTFTCEQRKAAEARREIEVRQLEARLGRLPLFRKSPDGVAYVVPIEPRRHDDLPVPLQAVKSVKFFVPLLYPLEQCTIELQGVAREAATKTERLFERKVIENWDTNLMGHVNYLAQNMHVFATTAEPEPESNVAQDSPDSENIAPRVEGLSLSPPRAEDGKPSAFDEDDVRAHVKVIPRPPEWAAGSGDEGSDHSDYTDSYDSGDEFIDEDHESHALESIPEASSDSAPERGISLSFPNLELYGIELLELVSLSITVKCERCKDSLDISNLRNAAGARSESCKKCASAFNVRFRRELVHANSVRAGYLDLDGCTVLDLLPR